MALKLLNKLLFVLLQVWDLAVLLLELASLLLNQSCQCLCFLLLRICLLSLASEHLVIVAVLVFQISLKSER